MGRLKDKAELLADRLELPPDALAGAVKLTVNGRRRVLIENHFGVKEYSRERIAVKVKYGFVCVCGCGLELIRMTREQLVISGRIDAVSLVRRG